MPRTDEAESFFYAVYSAIQEIPYGKVTSYGHIAKLVGTRTCSSRLFNFQIRCSNFNNAISSETTPSRGLSETTICRSGLSF